jgi:hypothetical protein
MKSSKPKPMICEYCKTTFTPKCRSRFCSPICRSRFRYPPKIKPFKGRTCAICKKSAVGMMGGSSFCETHFDLARTMFKLFRRSLK